MQIEERGQSKLSIRWPMKVVPEAGGKDRELMEGRRRRTQPCTM